MLSDKGIYVLGCYVMNKARASIQICFTYAVLSASCVDPFVLSYLLAGSSKFTSDQFCPLEKAEANCKHFCFFFEVLWTNFFFFCQTLHHIQRKNTVLLLSHTDPNGCSARTHTLPFFLLYENSPLQSGY